MLPNLLLRNAARRGTAAMLRRSGIVKSAATAAGAAFSSTASVRDAASPPFEKVLIANRGEIVRRVINTCRAEGVKTVAVYSTADANSLHVQDADEAYCIGPTPANESYIVPENVLEAVRLSGAQAVHPGYGFLSENQEFAQAVEDAGAVWLGPPPSAVHQMGDKLISKEVALAAGVNIIPGYDSPVESIEQAKEICNDVIGYPVLLKAAAGGGGKGMRTCYNDADIEEAWGLAKAEALNFFKDDRLLLEKYIEEPHHIEFQVMCTRNAEEVAVFPERECSIQRRNQKVIEETPSCLLKPETREQMAEQVIKLCKAVGYESAGTVEWLVDNNQNFYFLEMNTRLQVEHPVTESVCDVDLVKAMLWVGADRGLPDEIKSKMRPDSHVLPWKGHAVEARIYAEDPLRGYLPSTGPLAPYKEPDMTKNTPEAYVRMDSGVCEGHVVTPFYDPMLTKIIYYSGVDRTAACLGLAGALDEYVIEGVQHNARLVQAVLRHPSFLSGDTPTSFLPTHFPDGFHGVQLSDKDREEYAVAAAAIAAARRELLSQPPLPLSDADPAVVVGLGGMFGECYKVTLDGDKAIVRSFPKDGEPGPERVVKLDENVKYSAERCIADVTLDGVARAVQVVSENDVEEMKMQMYGSNLLVTVQSMKEYELAAAHMHEPVVEDGSKKILSPMPGTLVSMDVAVGDFVEPGQELCIVEAMKMQNVLRSHRAGTIAAVKAVAGDSLQTDQVIIEFEVEDDEEAA